MGSVECSGSDELTILVTGFQPFRAGYPVNPSWEICNSLPDYLPAPSSPTPGPSPAPRQPRVRILAYPHPVPVSYDGVRQLVPRLWGGGGEGIPPRVDFALHIGMAGHEPQFSVERRAHRDGYLLPDVDGVLLGDEERHRREGERWIWHGLPSELESDLDVDAVYQAWAARCPNLPGAKLRLSDDPGRFLCDFIYYSSLAELEKQGRRRSVAFLHVPSDPTLVDLGRDLTIRLLQSIVEVGLPQA